MTEWPKVYDWKSYVPQKGTAGSTPALSAIRRARCRGFAHGKPFLGAANALSLPAMSLSNGQRAVYIPVILNGTLRLLMTGHVIESVL